MNKQIVLELIHDLPDEIDLEDLHYRLYVLQKVEKGEEARRAGDVIPQEEVDRLSEEWLE